MHDVSPLVVRSALDVAASAGLSVDELLAGLPFDAVSLRKTKRVAWDDYATITERIEEACGSPDALQDLVASAYHRAWPPQLQTLLRAFVSPIGLAYFMATVLNPPMMRFKTHGFERLGPKRARFTSTLLPGARPCLAWFRASVGAIRGVPEHLGLGEADVEIEELTPKSLVCTADFPPSRALLGRSSAKLREVAAFVAMTLGNETRAQNERAVDILLLGRELSRGGDLSTLGDALLHNLGALGWSRVALYVTPEGGGPAVPCATAGDRSIDHVFVLTASGVEVGRLEVGGRGDAALLAELVPWVSIAVENARRLDVSTSSRVHALRELLDLSDRQTAVLSRIAQGMSNKEIAGDLGCAENTVEHHVTRLLRKVNVASRAQLVTIVYTYRRR
jgi:DNA-binding CsgD family transcriptional regulator